MAQLGKGRSREQAGCETRPAGHLNGWPLTPIPQAPLLNSCSSTLYPTFQKIKGQAVF